MMKSSNVRVTMVQLPALNTPQFGWVKSRLPRKTQPVPPIFQPEVAAEVIYFAAHNSRREFYVRLPWVKAIVANKFIPGLLDHFLARTGYVRSNTSTARIRTGRTTLAVCSGRSRSTRRLQRPRKIL
jgi:hypothetical protein